jgi:plastocyanin
MYLSATNEAGTDIVVKYITVLDPGFDPTVEFVAAPRNGPPGTAVEFFNVSSQLNSYACEQCKYLWDFGDGTSATDEDVSHTYAAEGLYTVSLTIFGLVNEYYGYEYRTETKVNYINIYPASTSTLNPDFVADRTTGTTPHMVQFSSLSGEGEDVVWDFGDGTSSELLNPKHVYKEPGRYTVTCSVAGEETVKADYINILSSVSGQMCPAALVLGNDEGQLSILRDFRDYVLNQSLPGRGLIELYYKHSLELVSILQADADLLAQAGEVLGGLVPGFESIIDGGTLTLTTTQYNDIKILIGKLSSQASPELGEVLAQLIIELSDGQFLESIGISGANE